MMEYHVGLLVQRQWNGNKAVFQFRRDVDFLDCEIVKYFGVRATTKTEAKRRLRDTRGAVLAKLRDDYPKYDFRFVGVD